MVVGTLQTPNLHARWIAGLWKVEIFPTSPVVHLLLCHTFPSCSALPALLQCVGMPPASDLPPSTTRLVPPLGCSRKMEAVNCRFEGYFLGYLPLSCWHCFFPSPPAFCCRLSELVFLTLVFWREEMPLTSTLKHTPIWSGSLVFSGSLDIWIQMRCC